MLRSLAFACVAAVPYLASAQGMTLRTPDIGAALHSMERAAGRSEPLAQTLVVQERPGQNRVSWYPFEWHTYDVPAPDGGPGKVRLYYYERERAVVERALPVIEKAYRDLAKEFHYSPTQTIPYFLYSSQREFLTTNVFAVTESVLGVTSPRDLKMSLPYFGDRELFREVSTHELVHQFNIQKLVDIAGAQGLSTSLTEALPLWFVEGLAEFYSKGGIDPETEAFLRDLVWNPDPEKHYEIPAFADDRVRGYIGTYKLGQARVAFIAEAYGREKLQSYIENAPLLVARPKHEPERGFALLTRRVLGESLAEVDARWRAWIKRRYYPEYMATAQDLERVQTVRDTPAEPESFAVSPDGQLFLVRGIDRQRGRAYVHLFDVRDPGAAVQVAADGLPGVESLHPVEYSVVALAPGTLAFSAQDGPGDMLYLQSYRHTPPKDGRPPQLSLGPRRAIPAEPPGGGRFLEIADPAFSPAGDQLAFVGTSQGGAQQIYVLPVAGGSARPITTGAYTKKDLSWGADGIFFASDATEHGKLNLFRIDPAGGQPVRLTTGAANHRHPQAQPDGSVLFSSDASGKSDLYLLQRGTVRRITDFTTGLSSPALAPSGRGVWASTFYRAQFRVVEVPRIAWLDQPAQLVAPPSGPPLPVALASIPSETPRYDPYSLSNWRPETGFLLGGGVQGAFGVEGALLFADTLGDRQLLVELAIYNSLDFTQVLLLYQDRSRRRPWALGLYHFDQPQFDRLDPNLQYLQRDFGAVGTLAFPLDRFRRFELELSVGGVQRYCLTDFNLVSPPDCSGIQTVGPEGSTADWERRNGGVQPQLSPTVRFGYDTVRYDPAAGPISGTSALLELGGGWLPTRQAIHGFGRLDAAQFIRLFGRTKLMLRLALGTSFAPNERSATWQRSWWISSADNLRGFSPFDTNFLVGQNYYIANVELQFPLSSMLRLLIFDDIQGVAALDFGGIFDQFQSKRQTICGPDGSGCFDVVHPGALGSRTLTAVLGANVLFGPFVLRVHFGHPFRIGGEVTPAIGSGTSWVTNVSLRYLFY
jgi:hypothetical protein